MAEDIFVEDGSSVGELGKELGIREGRLPFASAVSRNPHCLVGLCREGWADSCVYTHRHRLVKDELLVLLPGQLVSVSGMSRDFRLEYFTVEQILFDDVLSGIRRFPPHFYFYMRDHYHYLLSRENVSRMELYLTLLKNRAVSPGNLFRRESVIHVLRIFFLDMYNGYQIASSRSEERPEERQEDLANRFFRLLIDHYEQHKEVLFYANQLCITPKYLTMIVRRVSGKSAKEWISEYVVLEIKSLLKDTRLDIQEIVYRTHFANQSSMARFFRKHTGMSPLQYRKEKLVQR